MSSYNIEGLLIQKMPYKDHHVMAKILLRTGEVGNLIFYGANSSSNKKKMKAPLDLGNLLQIELFTKREEQTFAQARQWSVSWSHQKIRYHYQAFLILSFFLELAQKIAPEFREKGGWEKAEKLTAKEGESTFKILGRGVYLLDQYLEKENIRIDQLVCQFMIEILDEQGVFPFLANCTLCEAELDQTIVGELNIDHGGFICLDCARHMHLGADPMAPILWRVFAWWEVQKRIEERVGKVNFGQVIGPIWKYFCYHINLHSQQLAKLESMLGPLAH